MSEFTEKEIEKIVRKFTNDTIEKTISHTWIVIKWLYIFKDGVYHKLRKDTPIGKIATQLYCIETGETKEI